MKKTLLLGLAALFCLPPRGWTEPTSTIVCWYNSRDADPDAADFQRRGKGAYLRDGRVVVGASALSRLDFSKQGLATIAADQHGWLFVRRDGSTIPTIAYDNSADDFVEGLARYTDHGRMGFINESGEVVIPARYGFAFPFSDGYAVVCNGGKEVPVGEYHVLEGGRWGCINKKGKLVLPVKYPEDKLRQKLQVRDRRALD